jgi:hypothetical protein
LLALVEGIQPIWGFEGNQSFVSVQIDKYKYKKYRDQKWG